MCLFLCFAEAQLAASLNILDQEGRVVYPAVTLFSDHIKMCYMLAGTHTHMHPR